MTTLFVTILLMAAVSAFAFLVLRKVLRAPLSTTIGITVTTIAIALGVVLSVGIATAASVQTYWLTNVHSTTASQTLSSMVKGGCQTLTFAVPGTQAGDAVAVAVPSTAGILTLSVTPVATSGGVSVGICNGSFTAATYGGGTALTWGVTTFRQGFTF